MLKLRAWQKGAADLVTVAVGMVVLSIVVAGTSAAMVFGREALLRQEHYKTAAYLLRGKMEENIMALQIIPQATSDLRAMTYRPEALDDPRDRGGVEVVYCTISREPVTYTDLPETGQGIDYYTLTMSARWAERRLAGSGSYNNRQQREITYTTAVIVRRDLG